MIRSRICIRCEKAFSYEIGSGNDRKYCSAKCRNAAHVVLAKKRILSLPLCDVAGCTKRATRISSGLCETHYYRLRRTGSVIKPQSKYRYQYKGRYGYITLRLPNHPLANQRGNVDEHRKILYDSLGAGPHTCYWCGVMIDWNTAVVDHLNDQKADNKVENLALSCNECNRARGAALRILHRIRSDRLEQYIQLAREYYESRLRLAI
jgi:hypothetical protein